MKARQIRAALAKTLSVHPNKLSSRRDFLKAAILGSAALPLGFSALAKNESPAAVRKLIFNAPLTHSDWMLKPNIKWGPEGVQHMLDMCKEAGWSRVLWRVCDAGRATYKSKLLRSDMRLDQDSFWSPQTDEGKALVKKFFPGVTEAKQKELTAQFERFDYSTFDSLAEAVRYGHEIGLQIHAWISINEDDHGWGWPSEFSKKHPEFRWRRRNGTPYRSQLSFSFPEVRKYKLALLKELLRYDIDGFFLDWIRTGDVRDNPQNDSAGVADYGYEEPNLKKYKSKFKKNATDVANGDDAWVRVRAEPQTQFMREARKLICRQKRKLPVAAMVGHPWHYRGLMDKIDGNLRGLLLDVNAWAREGLMDSVVAAGYYRDGGNAELATQALQKETEDKVDVWLYGWVPNTPAEAEQTFTTADKVGAKEVLFWEADYIDDRGNSAEIKAAMRRRSA
jgi:uncharacterized lipoprotein YddW (UPF0748 family)